MLQMRHRCQMVNWTYRESAWLQLGVVVFMYFLLLFYNCHCVKSDESVSQESVPTISKSPRHDENSESKHNTVFFK